MKKIIPIILIVFGALLAATTPGPGIVFIAIGIIWLILQSKKNKKGNSSIPSEFTFAPVGLFAYTDNIISVMTENPYYNKSKNTDRRHYKYKFFEHECSLNPDPTNKHDKNAVQVMVDGKLIGYVPAEMCASVKGLLNRMAEPPVLKLMGGEYRYFENGEWMTGKNDFRGEVTIKYMK